MSRYAMRFPVRAVEIGLKIKEARQNKNVSTGDVCRALGVRYSTYARWENGSVAVSADSLEGLSKYLNVPISEFFSRPRTSRKDIELLCLHSDYERLGRRIKRMAKAGKIQVAAPSTAA